MKKIYLLKMYIKWNNVEISKKLYKSKAQPIIAYRNKKDALEALVDMMETAKTIQCSMYKKYYFIEEINLY